MDQDYRTRNCIKFASTFGVFVEERLKDRSHFLKGIPILRGEYIDGKLGRILPSSSDLFGVPVDGILTIVAKMVNTLYNLDSSVQRILLKKGVFTPLPASLAF